MVRAMVADTADGAGNSCATTLLLLSHDAGFLFISVSMALKDISTEDSFLPPHQRKDTAGNRTLILK